MIDIKTKTDEIYEVLKDYIQSKSQYNPKLFKSTIELTYPSVCFIELSNTKLSQTIDKRETIRALSFEIIIYTINDNNISSLVIADEIKQLVMEVFEGYYSMDGGFQAQLQNINTAKATQTTLRYNCKWFVEKNMIV